MNRRWIVRAALTAALLATACDNRACLAQSPLFESLRDDLIDECCTCLSRAGTAFPGAACGEATLGPDGGVDIPPDSGPLIPLDAPYGGDDLDYVVDPGPDGGLAEVPCLCEGNFATCVSRLSAGASIVVTGACISQGTGLGEQAPCENECQGVLSFDPLTTTP